MRAARALRAFALEPLDLLRMFMVVTTWMTWKPGSKDFPLRDLAETYCAIG